MLYQNIDTQTINPIPYGLRLTPIPYGGGGQYCPPYLKSHQIVGSRKNAGYVMGVV